MTLITATSVTINIDEIIKDCRARDLRTIIKAAEEALRRKLESAPTDQHLLEIVRELSKLRAIEVYRDWTGETLIDCKKHVESIIEKHDAMQSLEQPPDGEEAIEFQIEATVSVKAAVDKETFKRVKQDAKGGGGPYVDLLLKDALQNNDWSSLKLTQLRRVKEYGPDQLWYDSTKSA